MSHMKLAAALAAILAALIICGPADAAATANSIITGQWANRGFAQFLVGTSTASTIAAGTATSVTGSITNNILTVTAVGSGAIVNGALLSGTGILTGTQVINQLSGTTGGVGVYTISIGGQTIGSETITAAYGLLTIGGTVAGTYQIGSAVTGTNVLAGTVITQLGTGTGGAGTYDVNISQSVASTAINADAIGTYKTIYTAGWGAPNGTNGSKCFGLIETNNDASATHLITVQLVNSAGTKFPGMAITTASSDGFANAVPAKSLMSSGNWPGLPLDQYQNPYVILAPGDTIQATYATALTSGDSVSLYASCTDY